MTRTITALYDTHEAASAAVRELQTTGVLHSDISIVANHSDSGLDATKASDAADDAGKGAGIGATIGGLGGLLTGLGVMAIPGVGPVVAAGWLAATAAGAVTGAAVGAAGGGLVGAMTESGVPEDDAHIYAEGVRRGGTLVTARVEDSRAAVAQAVLDRNKAVNVSALGETYRASGWSSFDPASPAYSAEEIARERSRTSL